MKRRIQGFGLIESMITLVILSVAFLALATLMMRAQSVRQQNSRFQEAQFLTKKKISELAALQFVELATGTDPTTDRTYGAPDEIVVLYGPLNKEGLLSSEGGAGPFLYTQSFVICLDDAYGGQSAPGTADACGDVTLQRPSELSCDVTRTQDGQAEIRVLTTYRDKDGKCHKVTLSNIVVDMEIT